MDGKLALEGGHVAAFCPLRLFLQHPAVQALNLSSSGTEPELLTPGSHIVLLAHCRLTAVSLSSHCRLIAYNHELFMAGYRNVEIPTFHFLTL